jgi:hypothetical protein
MLVPGTYVIRHNYWLKSKEINSVSSHFKTMALHVALIYIFYVYGLPQLAAPSGRLNYLN